MDTNQFATGYGDTPQAPKPAAPTNDPFKAQGIPGMVGGVNDMVRALMKGTDEAYNEKKGIFGPGGMLAQPTPQAPGAPMNIQPPIPQGPGPENNFTTPFEVGPTPASPIAPATPLNPPGGVTPDAAPWWNMINPQNTAPGGTAPDLMSTMYQYPTNTSAQWG